MIYTSTYPVDDFGGNEITLYEGSGTVVFKGCDAGSSAERSVPMSPGSTLPSSIPAVACPTDAPTNTPTGAPTDAPTNTPTGAPTDDPADANEAKKVMVGVVVGVVQLLLIAAGSVIV